MGHIKKKKSLLMNHDGFFWSPMQDELNSTMESWNSHVIHPSTNEHVPHGRPNAMYLILELYETEDHLCQVLEEDLTRCEDDCIHRSDIACDDDSVHPLHPHHGTKQSPCSC